MMQIESSAGLTTPPPTTSTHPNNTVLLQFPPIHHQHTTVITLPTTRIVDRAKHAQLERIMTGDSTDGIIPCHNSTSIDSHPTPSYTTVGFDAHQQRAYSTGANSKLQQQDMHVLKPVHITSPAHSRMHRSASSHVPHNTSNHTPLHASKSHIDNSVTKQQSNTFTPKHSNSSSGVGGDEQNKENHVSLSAAKQQYHSPSNSVKKSTNGKRKKTATPKDLNANGDDDRLKTTAHKSRSPSPNVQHRIRSSDHSVDSDTNGAAADHGVTAGVQQKKPATLFQFFGKSEPTGNRLQRNNSTVAGAQDHIISTDSVESIHNDTWSPITGKHSTNSKTKQPHAQHHQQQHQNKKQKVDDNKQQAQLLARENEIQLREYQLTQREKEYEIRFSAAVRAQQAACNTQATIDSLEQQMTEVNTEFDEFKSKVQSVLRDVLVEAAVLRQREMEEKLIRDKFRIGQVVSHREGHMICDVWENGEAYREIRQKIDVLEKQRDELEQIRKRLNRKKVHAAKQASKSMVGGDSAMMDSGDGEFKRPMSVHVSSHLASTADIELSVEMDEVYKVKTGLIKKELDGLKEEERKLEIMKKTLIRQQRLLLDQQNSRFNAHQCFEQRYILIEMLGKGGFSEVYKAFDLKTLQYVACKIHQLNSSWSNEKKLNYTKHATREYNIHRSLSHSRVVKLFDVFAIDLNSFCTVLEYCNGNDLDYYLKNRLVLNEREARAIIMQVFSGLKYLNEQKCKIIHYDLKPGNILFNSGEVKITDFGLSKQLNEMDNCAIELTSQGAGTYWYLPPECFASNNNTQSNKIMISSKVDVWSCGVILYQMVCGRKPFGHGVSAEQILQQKVMENARHVEFPAQCKLSDVTKEFIRKCLSYNPDDRPDVLTFQDDMYFKYNGFKREL